MTEADWLDTHDLKGMLDYLQGRTSDRRLRLFACACARLVWDLLDDPRSREALATAEAFADSLASLDALMGAEGMAWNVHAAHRGQAAPATKLQGLQREAAWIVMGPTDWFSAMLGAVTASTSVLRATEDDSERARQGQLLRDVLRSMVPNPFRPLPVLPTGKHLHNLALAAYAHRLADGRLDPVRLAVLADALEDAQAPEESLQALRATGPRFRGLWVLDRLLNMEPEMTLREYANDREHVVLFWSSTGQPAGDHVPLGNPDFDMPERLELLDLDGRVNERGDWLWDGHGDPRDDFGNTILRLQAHCNPGRWQALVDEQ